MLQTESLLRRKNAVERGKCLCAIGEKLNDIDSIQTSPSHSCCEMSGKLAGMRNTTAAAWARSAPLISTLRAERIQIARNSASCISWFRFPFWERVSQRVGSSQPVSLVVSRTSPVRKSMVANSASERLSEDAAPLERFTWAASRTAFRQPLQVFDVHLLMSTFERQLGAFTESDTSNELPMRVLAFVNVSRL